LGSRENAQELRPHLGWAIPRGGVMRNRLNILSLPFLFSAIFLFPGLALAQTTGVTRLITQPVDDSNLIVLHGNTYPLARPQYDRGPAPSTLPMQRMLLVLQRSPLQQAALDQLLEQQQDNSSPSYHQWLTPAQFGAQFGPADQDVQAVTLWLQSHGFQVNRVSSGRIVIEFSGTAGQVQEAFHTSIHKYQVEGESHWANSSDPQIPAALDPVVAGVRSLHNFPAKPMNHPAGVFHRDAKSGKFIPLKPVPIPQFLGGGGCGILGGPCEFLGPYDLAAIYDISPLWTAATPIDGTGQTIAIVGETDINPDDWTAFWNAFGATTPEGNLKIILDGPDPGFQDDESEADIDTQWSSAVAKGATIDFVESESTESTLGVDLSAEYIVDNNLAPVMSESYGLCELFIGTTGNAYYNALWQQASAQGITVFVSSGDQGSAVCDRGDLAAEFGLAVSGFGSTAYNVAVGGTDFNDLNTTSTYWNPSNNANQANARGYIPEETWNDTCTNAELFVYLGTTTASQTCNNADAQNDGFLSVAGGSGGASACTNSNGQSASSCTGGNAKPPWQTGTGVPNDMHRDVPDVSLFASNGFNGTGYIVCQSDQTGPCNVDGGEFLGFGGTSVSSPAFAGIMALVNQKSGERQGNANYVLYKMASTAANSCDSSTVISTGTNSCIFYDVTTGTIAMPCVDSSGKSCTIAGGDVYGVLSGYATTTGYDQATGLGTVNVANLVNQWSTYAGQFKATAVNPFTLGPPATITHGQSLAVAATVKPQTGTGTPTGTISLIANTGSALSGQQAVPQVFTLTSGSIVAGATTTALPGGTNFTVKAHYSGDTTFAASDSAPFTITVNPEASKSSAMVETYNAATGQIINENATSFTYGTPTLLRSNITNSSGNLCAPTGNEVYTCPTGTVSLNDTFNPGTGPVTNPIAGSPYSLNGEGYTEDQSLFLLGGQHSIVATYNSDNSYLASNNSAAPDVVTVSPAATTIALSPTSQNGQAGGAVFLTATISTQAALPSNALPADFPIHNVQFYLGSTPITVTPPSAIIYGNGFEYGTQYAQLTATLQIYNLPYGNSSITAQFVGDSNYSQSAVSNSATVDNQGETLTTVTSSNPTIQHGSSVTFTAIIAPNPSGGPALTGTVQFNDSGTNFGSPVAVVNGKAQITTSTLPGGNQYIYAYYSGDVNYQNSYNVFQESVVLLVATTTLTTSNSVIQQGTSVTLTAQVAPTASGGPVLTGNVQFWSAFSPQGTNNFFGNPVTLSNGQAQIITSTLPPGIQLVGASYSGDANYATSSGTAAQTVTPAPTFGATASPATMDVTSPGASGTMNLILTGMNGFTGTIPLSSGLFSGLPSETTCSFNMASVALTGSGSTATPTATCQTTAPSSTAMQFPNRSTRNGPWWTIAGTLALACALSIGLLVAGHGGSWRRWSTAFALLALASSIAVASCGGGGSTNTGPPPNPGTPRGLDSSAVVTFSGAGVTPSPTLHFSIDVE